MGGSVLLGGRHELIEDAAFVHTCRNPVTCTVFALRGSLRPRVGPFLKEAINVSDPAPQRVLACKYTFGQVTPREPLILPPGIAS